MILLLLRVPTNSKSQILFTQMTGSVILVGDVFFQGRSESLSELGV